MRPTSTPWLLATIILLSLPLAGMLLNRQEILIFLEFPPMTRLVVHPPFNWTAFIIIASLNLLMLSGLAYLLMHNKGRISPGHKSVRHPFPSWGWLGVMIILAGWWLAWTRHPWFASLQHHTFCMPWIGYIILLNAWCYQRSGSSLLHERPGRFILLFPVSAIFWWYFEYINRIVQNWYYIGIDDLNPATYTLFASLAFSTVLPAVLSTHRLLLTLPLFNQRLAATFVIRRPCPPILVTLLLLLSVLSLMLLSRFPAYLYPLVWVAPLMVVITLQRLCHTPTIFAPLGRGDWSACVASTVAALICGFFWELWNYHSLAQWVYTIPFVNRFHLFAMPALGYGGYLPFGLECLLAGTLVVDAHHLGINYE